MAWVTTIFGRSNAAVGLMIRILDGSPWQHMGILDEQSGFVYESTASRYKGRRGRRKGLVKTEIAKFKKRYTAWRTKLVWTNNENWREDCEALLKKGIEYDYAGTVSKFYLFQLLKIDFGSKHNDNCSEFVERVLKRFIDGYSPSVGDWWRLRS